MKSLGFIIILFLLTSFVSDKISYKTYKWTIKEWRETYLIDIPKPKFKSWNYWNGRAKGLEIIFQDSSIIYVRLDTSTYDPSIFDTIASHYSPSDGLIKYYNLNCHKLINTIDSFTINDTIVHFGQLNNGRFWKDEWFKRGRMAYVMCYVNVLNYRTESFNKSLKSFRKKENN